MAAPKGHARYGGRIAGTPNKFTQTAKEAFQLAFDGLGGVKNLIAWGADNTTEFYKIYGRLIPTDVNAVVTQNPIEALSDVQISQLARLVVVATEQDSGETTH
jgi:hypothetical protein